MRRREQHAGSADVLVRYMPRELQLQVTDDRAGGDSGAACRPPGSASGCTAATCARRTDRPAASG